MRYEGQLESPPPKRTHPAFWWVLFVCYGIFVVVPIVLAKYPFPNSVLDWCPSGYETGNYTIEKLATALVALVALAGISLVLAAATLTPRVIWIQAIWILFATGSGLGAYWLAVFIKGGRIECGLYT